MSILKRLISFTIVLLIAALAVGQICRSPIFKRIYFDYSTPISIEVVLEQAGKPIPADKPTGEFFPFGFFGVNDIADFVHFRGTYINTIHSHRLNWVEEEEDSVIQAYLDCAQKAGLKVIFNPSCLYTELNEKGAYKLAKRRIDKFKDHSALLSWYLASEPFNYDMPPKRINKVHKYIKKVDPVHPTWLVEVHPKWNRGEYYSKLKGVVDIMGVEPYLRGIFPMRYIQEYIQAVRSYCPGQPIWMVAEAHAKDEIGCFPSAEEIRAQTYEGLIDGASAMFYFNFKREDVFYQQILNYPRQWREIKLLAEEVFNLRKAWQSPSVPLADLPEEINISLRQYGNWYLLVILNREQELLSLDLKTANGFLKGYTVRDYYGKMTDFRLDSDVQLDFAPFEVKIFWLIP